jgi:xylulokinase
VKRCVIGCDIGSQGVKAALVSESGELLGEAGAGYAIHYPAPAWAEQPAESWMEALARAVRQVLAETGVRREAVAALGLDAQVDGVVAVDGAGQALRPAIIWMDRRAVAQCQAAAAGMDPAEIRRLSGLNLDASHVAPKIRWLADHEPQVYARARHFLLPGSYAGLRLTGELGVDYSNASSTLLLDVHTRQYSPALCELFEVPASRLAPVYPATQVLGRLLPGMAEALGLSPQVQVVLGSGDEHAACLGAGVVRPGAACDIGGTAEPVCAASPHPLIDPGGLVETHCHADPESWLLENPGFVSGANYRWFKENFGQPEVEQAAQQGVEAYDLLNHLAEQAPPGSQGLVMLPCLMGAMAPTWNAQARGVFLGFTLAHGRQHFARAVLEASAFAVRDITAAMQGLGLELTELRAVGGAARSPLWRQIKADVTGLPVSCLHTVETTALGAAVLALAGAGLVPALGEAAAAAARVVETRQPDPAAQRRYDELYQVYRAAYFSLLPVFEQAAHLSG